MIITNTQLNEIERHVGHACQVGIVLGNTGGAMISVSAKKESG